MKHSKPCQALFEAIFNRQNKKQLLTFSVCFVSLFRNVSVYKVGFKPYEKVPYWACENEISSKSTFFQEIKNTKNYFFDFLRSFPLFFKTTICLKSSQKRLV